MPFGWAVALGAANYVNKKVMENRAADASETAAMAEDIRVRKQADDAAVYATSQLMAQGRNNEFVVVPDYSTGGTKTIALNQYSTKASTTPSLSPDVDLAYYNALSTKENKIDGSKHRFVAINPNLTPDILKAGQYSDGTAVVPNKDYILFSNVSPTAGERETTGISNWREKLLESEEGLKLALSLARNGDNRAISKIMGVGSDLVQLWQKGQEPQAMLEGKTYFQANPFGETGPLAFMKDVEYLKDEEFFKPFMATVAEQTPFEFINSLNELGYDIPINNPVTYTLDGNAVTVDLTGDWDDLKVPAGDSSRRGFSNRTEWGSEFQNTIGSWAARSNRSQYEWMRLLNNVANENVHVKDAREAWNRITAFEETINKLGQPVDFTSGRPVYRQSWGMAIKDEFTALLSELNLKGEDASTLVGALMPEDMYKGIKTRVLSGGKDALQAIRPGSNLQDLRNEYTDVSKSIRNAQLIKTTIPAGTGITADLKTLQAGAASQIEQLTQLFGANPEGIRGTMLDTLKGFFTEDELDPSNLAQLGRDDLLLKVRKFAVIQLMYSFAKGMGGSGSDRLSDQDAKNALEALQVSGLLNSQEGMNVVMTTLINGMEKRQQVLAGLTSGSEREVIGGLFLDNMYSGRRGFDMTDAIMEAWTTQYQANPSSVSGNPATQRSSTRKSRN